jgi:hypothetical protein
MTWCNWRRVTAISGTSRRTRLFHNPYLELVREALPVTRSADHFQSMDGSRLQLKHIIKLRVKPISDSEIDHPAQPVELEGAVKTPLRNQQHFTL